MDMKLIVGLGNPGRTHAKNRHNIGFLCLDRLARAYGLSFGRRQAKAKVTSGYVGGCKVLLAKPQTFMNLSGQSVGRLVRFYKVLLEDVLVVFDDLDLPLGTIRLRAEGGAGGHNGMRSIIQTLDTQAFPRLRVGIDRPPGRMDPADYVLTDFSTEEQAVVDEVLERAVAAIEMWLSQGIEAAMNAFNNSTRVADE